MWTWIGTLLLLVLFALLIVLVVRSASASASPSKDYFHPHHTINPSPLNPTTNCDVVDNIVQRVNTILASMFPAQNAVGDIQINTAGKTYTIPSSDLQFPLTPFSVSRANHPGSTTLLMNPNGPTASLVGPNNTWQEFQLVLQGSSSPVFYAQSGRFYVNVFDRAGYPVCSNSFNYVENASTGALYIQNFSSMKFNIPPPSECTVLVKRSGTSVQVPFQWSIENTELTVKLGFSFFACMLGTGWCQTKSGNPFSSGFYECNDTQPACPHDQVCDAPLSSNGTLSVTFHVSIPGTGSFLATKNRAQQTLDISNIQLTTGTVGATITHFSFQFSSSVQQALVNIVKPYLQNALQNEVVKIVNILAPKIVSLINQNLVDETISFST